jgi:hypothetical protein
MAPPLGATERPVTCSIAARAAWLGKHRRRLTSPKGALAGTRANFNHDSVRRINCLLAERIGPTLEQRAFGMMASQDLGAYPLD